MDYRKILIAYIDYVADVEGIDFLPAELAGLTKEENIALHEAALESPDDISKEHIADMQRYIEGLKGS